MELVRLRETCELGGAVWKLNEGQRSMPPDDGLFEDTLVMVFVLLLLV